MKFCQSHSQNQDSSLKISGEIEVFAPEQKNKAVPTAEVELSLQLGNESGFAVLGVLNTAPGVWGGREVQDLQGIKKLTLN